MNGSPVKIPEIIELTFRPDELEGEVAKVFKDDLARTLWLAIKRSHVVAKGFNSLCLAYAKKLRGMDKEELTAERLFSILNGSIDQREDLIGTKEIAFARELLPFVKGKKELRYDSDKNVYNVYLVTE